MQTATIGALVLALGVWGVGCRRRARGACRAVTETRAVGLGQGASGLWWGRWSDVPEGAWVAVWVDVWARPGGHARWRGSWDMPPWHGEIQGALRPDGGVELLWHEEGVVAVHQTRARTVVLRPDASGMLLQGDGVMLRRVRPAPPTLRAGLWLSRWTGLPAGMAVETTLTPTETGWRAAYRYQGRDGSFDAQPLPSGGLALQWREVSARDTVGHGGGRLLPTPLGLRGTYGANDDTAGLGLWSLEPFDLAP